MIWFYRWALSSSIFKGAFVSSVTKVAKLWYHFGMITLVANPEGFFLNHLWHQEPRNLIEWTVWLRKFLCHFPPSFRIIPSYLFLNKTMSSYIFSLEIAEHVVISFIQHHAISLFFICTIFTIFALFSWSILNRWRSLQRKIGERVARLKRKSFQEKSYFNW